MKFKVILEQEEDGKYSVHCPALKGCHSWGETREEAFKNIEEAIIGCLEALNQKTEESRKKYKFSEISEIAI